MPIKQYICKHDQCEYVNRDKKTVSAHEKQCKTAKVCNNCRFLDFFMGSYACTSSTSRYGKGETILPEHTHLHTCESYLVSV